MTRLVEIFNLAPFDEDPGLTMAMRLSMDSFRNETVFSNVPGPVKSPTQRAALIASVRASSVKYTLPMLIRQLREVEVCNPAKLSGLLTKKGRLRANLSCSEQEQAREALECGCSICLSPGMRGWLSKPTCCSSLMHTKCLVHWVELGHNSCPVCRSDLTTEQPGESLDR